MSKILISTGVDEIVESGRRFGSEWARLKQKFKKKGKGKDKWFDNMILKLDSPTSEGFHKILRKMIRTFYEEEQKFKWNISTEVLSLLSNKSKSYFRHAFMTGVFFGYYGYFEKTKNKEGEE